VGGSHGWPKDKQMERERKTDRKCDNLYVFYLYKYQDFIIDHLVIILNSFIP